MSMKLRDLIRAIRSCKTAAEERAVITKESALIRGSFKDDSTEYRHRNVAKLLYIWLLGYPAHFGYIECIKLLASARFNEKRIGYLALMLLLDERQEVLTLVTNSMQMDMAHPNQFVAGLALTTLGNIGSAEMARDLATDVDRHLRGDNGYTRKKAALCCIRLLRKVPDLLETFIPHIVVLLTDKTHHVLLTGVALVTTVVEVEPSYAGKLSRLVPALVKILRKLLAPGGHSSSEYDIGGVTDPFLQVKILRLLRVLGAGNATAGEAMHAVLAQVATNTEAVRNAGNAVLYELVQTIMGVEAEPGLRTLGVNILGKFLSSKEPNLKYVALETLTKVVSPTGTGGAAAVDTSAVQKHRSVIVDCLRDTDVSISRRALDLVYCLVNAENVQPLTRELLQYTAVADVETKTSLCVKIAAAADRFAPSKRWHIDTLIALLAVAGNTAKPAVASQALFLLAHATPTEHASIVHKLFSMAAGTSSPSSTVEAQQPLLQIAAWAVGEYGELLTRPPPPPPAAAAAAAAATGAGTAAGGAAATAGASATAAAGATTPDADSALVGGVGPLGEMRTEGEVVRTVDRLLHLYYATGETKAMLLTTLLKLATGRFKEAAAIARCRAIITSFSSSGDLELQARGVEYSMIASPDAVPTLAGHRSGLLAPMPLLEEAVLRARAAASGAATALAGGEEVAMAVSHEKVALAGAGTAGADAAGGGAASVSLAAASGLEEEEDALGLGLPVGGSGAKPAAAASAAGGATAASLLDDLSDLLGTTTITGSAAAPAAAAAAFAPAAAPAAAKPKPAAPVASASVDLDDLFSTVTKAAGSDLLSSPTQAPASTAAPAAHAAAPAAAASASGGLGALDDLFGGGAPAAAPAKPVAAAAAPAAAASAAAAAASAADEFGDLVEAAPPALTLPHVIPAAYASAHVRLSLSCDKPGHDLHSPQTDITATFTAAGGGVSLSNFVCQVAAAKYLKLTLLPASSNAVVAGGAGVTQIIRVENSAQGAKPIKLKLRLTFNVPGAADPIVESPELSAFPPTL